MRVWLQGGNRRGWGDTRDQSHGPTHVTTTSNKMPRKLNYNDVPPTLGKGANFLAFRIIPHTSVVTEDTYFSI